MSILKSIKLPLKHVFQGLSDQILTDTTFPLLQRPVGEDKEGRSPAALVDATEVKSRFTWWPFPSEACNLNLTVFF